MKPMLEFLFSSELSFPRSWSEESRFGAALEGIKERNMQIQTLLGEDHAELWQEYLKKAQQLQNWDCQMEFERGFLVAAKLACEIFGRSRDAAE